MTGDLVNGGPRSLEVLRWAREQHAAGRLEAVLGNHDIYCLARAADVVPRQQRDTLDALLDAPDRDELIDWLRARPLFVRTERFALLHAGLRPAWSLDDAAEHAAAAERSLRDDGWRDFLAGYFEDKRANPVLEAYLTLRTCREDGQSCRKFKGPPSQAPEGCRAWYAWRDADEVPLVFGHWAAHGLHVGADVVGLDSGCVWGGALTAMLLSPTDEREIVQQDALE